MANTFLREEWNIESFPSQSLESNRFDVGGLTWYIQLQKVEDQISFSLNLATQLSEESHLVLFTLALSGDPIRRADVLYEFTDKKTTVVDKLVDVHLVCPLKLSYIIQVIDREKHHHLISCLDPKHWQELLFHYGKEVESTLKKCIQDEKVNKRRFIEKHWPRIARLKLGSDTKDTVDELLDSLKITQLLIVESLCLVVVRLKQPKPDAIIKMDEDGDVVVDIQNFLYFFRKSYEEDTHGNEMGGSIAQVLKLVGRSLQLMVFNKVIDRYAEKMGFPKMKRNKDDEPGKSHKKAGNEGKKIARTQAEIVEKSSKEAEEIGKLVIKDEDEEDAARRGKGKGGPTKQRKSKVNRRS